MVYILVYLYKRSTIIIVALQNNIHAPLDMDFGISYVSIRTPGAFLTLYFRPRKLLAQFILR